MTTGTSTRILEVPTADWDDKRSLKDLREHILTGLDKPVVFHSRINSWSATKQWSPTQVCTLLAKKLTVFKICPKKWTPEFQSHFKENEPIFETQCEYAEATFADFLEWSCSEPVSCLRGEIHYTDSPSMTANTESHGGVDRHPEPPTKRLKVHENISQESSQSCGTWTNPLLHYTHGLNIGFTLITSTCISCVMKYLKCFLQLTGVCLVFKEEMGRIQHCGLGRREPAPHVTMTRMVVILWPSSGGGKGGCCLLLGSQSASTLLGFHMRSQVCSALWISRILIFQGIPSLLMPLLLRFVCMYKISCIVSVAH